MRKIIEYCLVSADGIVLNDPFPFRDYDDDAYLRDRLGVFAACDAILWGRTTYERFARLPRSGGIPPICGASQCDPKVRLFVKTGDGRVE
jgi:hypothetical protein